VGCGSGVEECKLDTLLWIRLDSRTKRNLHPRLYIELGILEVSISHHEFTALITLRQLQSSHLVRCSLPSASRRLQHTLVHVAQTTPWPQPSPSKTPHKNPPINRNVLYLPHFLPGRLVRGCQR